MRSLLLLTTLFPAVAAEKALDLEARCEISDVVAIAEVTSLETRWNEDGTIGRLAWLEPVATVRGRLDGRPVALQGGQLDGLTYWVEHSPVLLPDHTYVLFLADRGEELAPSAGGQSVLPVRRGPRGTAWSLAEAREALETCRVP